uniref:Uncharacterized protein n=1 Tax=Triticum urartu TaxID=4572 RepID=A0A8R7PWX7_TRIUA
MQNRNTSSSLNCMFKTPLTNDKLLMLSLKLRQHIGSRFLAVLRCHKSSPSLKFSESTDLLCYPDSVQPKHLLGITCLRAM